MLIRITRTDPLAGIPDSHDGGVLTDDTLHDWEQAFTLLRSYGVPITQEHEAEFRAHPETQFQRWEMVNAGVVIYLCNVNYDVCVAGEVEGSLT